MTQPNNDPNGCGANPNNPDCSPIIINFSRGSYELTGANSPVLFDIAAIGAKQRIGWTAAGADEAFLWRDLNHNGIVDDGAELFGTAMRLQNGHTAVNGFEALKEFDSNHDGVIDDRDPIWSELLLWRDLNHDGVSQPSEITPIAASDVTAIDLDYQWTGRHDSYGNAFRYKSTVWLRSSRHSTHSDPRPLYDIFFVPVN